VFAPAELPDKRYQAFTNSINLAIAIIMPSQKLSYKTVL
jgi:hypothetical protein